jgi:hypothetical protein
MQSEHAIDHSEPFSFSPGFNRVNIRHLEIDEPFQRFLLFVFAPIPLVPKGEGENNELVV